MLVVHERAQTADRGRDHRRSARGRLERDEPERLRARRHDAHVGGAVVVGEPFVPAGADPVDLLGDAELVGERVHAGLLGRGRRDRSGRRRSTSASFGSSSAASARIARSAPFSRWMRPTNNSTRGASMPRRWRAASRSPGTKTVWSTPGGTTSMRSSSASYSDASCARSSVGGREHQIGARDHFVLDARAVLGVVVDAGFGLHARERVERRDERQVELVLQPVRDRAREPVVPVQHVDRVRARASAASTRR